MHQPKQLSNKGNSKRSEDDMSIDDLSVEVIHPSGALRVYTMINGFYTEARYEGYTVEEAKQLFMEVYAA